ncbi:protein kinase [Streptomyces sp. NPDC058676]|uniref:serine/threonine-protein kinase n=1 Tax=unclassified Streptomyces TaxID=2593676 RepID=UPI003659E811
MGEVFAGRYELADPIGRGGVGAVWRAWDHRRRRYVAAKVLQQRDAHALLRFVREQALRIDHPHVLAPASWAADDDKVLFTMDLVAGGSLVHLVNDYGPLPPAFVCTLLDQLLAGLAAVHAEGVVHRDVKPANVLLEATGTGRPRLRLSDFGIAMRLGEPRLTETNLVVGTPGYLAPEQMMGAEPDFPADLFAVGLTALYLLEGAKPDAKALIQYFTAHGTPSAPQGIPDPLWQVVGSLLQPDPHARFRTATGARKALASAVELLPEPGPDDEVIEIFDQLGPLPAGFAPNGPLERAPGVETGSTSRWPAERASRSGGGASSSAGGAPPAGDANWSATGPAGRVERLGSVTGAAGRLEGPRAEESAAGSLEDAPEPAERAAGGVPSAPRTGTPFRPLEGSPSQSGAAGMPLAPEPGHATSPQEDANSGSGSAGAAPAAGQNSAPLVARSGTDSFAPGPGAGSMAAQVGPGHIPPAPGADPVPPHAASGAIPVGQEAETVSPDLRQGTGWTSAPGSVMPLGPASTPAPRAVHPQSSAPTPAPRAVHPQSSAPTQPPTMSDTGSFHLPPPQTTATTPTTPEPTPQRPHGQPQPQAHPQPQPHAQPHPTPPAPVASLHVSAHDPTHVLSTPGPHATAPHHTPYTPATALHQRAEPSTASYTAQAPQVPPPAQATSQPRHRAARSARRFRPPAKVAIPLLLLALTCYAVGFWALARI